MIFKGQNQNQNAIKASAMLQFSRAICFLPSDSISILIHVARRAMIQAGCSLTRDWKH